MSSININRFMGSIDNMARPNNFNVHISGPAGMPDGSLSSRGIRCTNIVMPGRSFVTTPHSEYHGGPKVNRIGGIEYDGGLVQMTFICDTTYEDKQKLELWQQYIFDDAYYYRYYDSYVGKVEIEQLASDGTVIYAVELQEAYPQAIAAQTLDASSTAVQTFTCTFAFRRWSTAFENTPTGILGSLFKKYSRKLNSRVDRKLDKITNKLTTKLSDKIDDIF
tara:strand:+ start:132 stop:794 length:663 start_codon:yes stop_codon:yes gene_type:complete